MSIDIRFVFACMFVMKTSSDTLDLKLNVRWNSANIHTDPKLGALQLDSADHHMEKKSADCEGRHAWTDNVLDRITY